MIMKHASVWYFAALFVLSVIALCFIQHITWAVCNGLPPSASGPWAPLVAQRAMDCAWWPGLFILMSLAGGGAALFWPSRNVVLAHVAFSVLVLETLTLMAMVFVLCTAFWMTP